MPVGVEEVRLGFLGFLGLLQLRGKFLWPQVNHWVERIAELVLARVSGAGADRVGHVNDITQSNLEPDEVVCLAIILGDGGGIELMGRKKGRKTLG